MQTLEKCGRGNVEMSDENGHYMDTALSNSEKPCLERAGGMFTSHELLTSYLFSLVGIRLSENEVEKGAECRDRTILVRTSSLIFDISSSQ